MPIRRYCDNKSFEDFTKRCLSHNIGYAHQIQNVKKKKKQKRRDLDKRREVEAVKQLNVTVIQLCMR